MPELAEVRIMSDFINENSDNRKYNKIFDVQKGNTYKELDVIKDEFEVKSTSSGKELTVNLISTKQKVEISVFMGMSGNWKFVKTSEIDEHKYIRLRLDTIDGYSLICWGSYMGPKYKLGKFNGTKRGPDPTKDFDKFKSNVINNLHRKVFEKPICEVLLNQEYFSGIGNYLRSTILYYADVNPFESARESLSKNQIIFDLCRDIPNKAYELNGGQLRDWKNPNEKDATEFSDWVFYQKGKSCKDSGGRTFWFDAKWSNKCIYKIEK